MAANTRGQMREVEQPWVSPRGQRLANLWTRQRGGSQLHDVNGSHQRPAWDEHRISIRRRGVGFAECMPQLGDVDSSDHVSGSESGVGKHKGSTCHAACRLRKDADSVLAQVSIQLKVRASPQGFGPRCPSLIGGVDPTEASAARESRRDLSEVPPTPCRRQFRGDARADRRSSPAATA